MMSNIRIQFGVGLVVIIFLATISTSHTQTTTPAPGGNTTTSVVDSSNGTTGSSGKKKDPRLTGDPRKDYIYDPNLPRELNGFDLSYYPFYPLVPEDINFTCADRHDGYYASIPHHCQLFHYCVVGVRYDFLCANYTVFDQTQFICQFVNVVNCGNSEKFYDRNNDLYEPTTTLAPEEEYRPRRRYKNRSKKRTTTPPPEYYDEEYYDYEEEVIDEPTTVKTRPSRPKSRPYKNVAETQTDPQIAEETLSDEQAQQEPQEVQQRPAASKPKIRPPRPVRIRSKAEVSSTEAAVPVEDPEIVYDDYEAHTEEPIIPKETPAPVQEVQPAQRRRPSSRPRGDTERKPAEHDSAGLEEEVRAPPSRGSKLSDKAVATTKPPSRIPEEKSAPAPPRRRTTTPATEGEYPTEEHPINEQHPVEEVKPLRRPTASRRVAIPEKAKAVTVVPPEEEQPKQASIYQRPKPVIASRPSIGARNPQRSADAGEDVVADGIGSQNSNTRSVLRTEPENVEKKIEEPLPSEGPVKVRVVQRRRKPTTAAPKTTTVAEYADYEQV